LRELRLTSARKKLACKALRTGFVIIDIFVQRKAAEKELIDCVCILDVIAYLPVDDSCGMNQSRWISKALSQVLCVDDL
jgi:hypothetical protein